MCYVEPYFIFSSNACYAILFPITAAINHQGQQNMFVFIWYWWGNVYYPHAELVLSHRMTTSWMCCSCWWLSCLNILVPWSRLLTSATGFGKKWLFNKCASFCHFYLGYWHIFFKIVRHFINPGLWKDINMHFRQMCHMYFGLECCF